MCKAERAPKEPKMECETEPEKKEEQQTSGGDAGLSLVIELTTNAILKEEMMDVASTIVDYRKNLARYMLSESDELFHRIIQFEGVAKGIREGWRVWKEGGTEKREASYEEFKKQLLFEEV